MCIYNANLVQSMRSPTSPHSLTITPPFSQVLRVHWVPSHFQKLILYYKKKRMGNLDQRVLLKSDRQQVVHLLIEICLGPRLQI